MGCSKRCYLKKGAVTSDITVFVFNMQHKRATKHNFFRLKQIWTVIQNRITVHICLNARKLTMFCHTLVFLTKLKYRRSGQFHVE